MDHTHDGACPVCGPCDAESEDCGCCYCQAVQLDLREFVVPVAVALWLIPRVMGKDK